MGFKHWLQGLIVIGVFWVIIGTPCAIIALWGSKMINDIGNHPSKSGQIITSFWWVYLLAFIFFLFLMGYGSFLYNLNTLQAVN